MVKTIHQLPKYEPNPQNPSFPSPKPQTTLQTAKLPSFPSLPPILPHLPTFPSQSPFYILLQRMSSPSTPPACPQVLVYLRNSQKRAYVLRLPRYFSSDELFPLVSEKLALPVDRLLLFLRGQRIQTAQELTFTDRCILHVVDSTQIHRPHLQIHIKRLSSAPPLAHFTIPSSTLVVDFINTHLQPLYHQSADEIFLVYTGKQLSLAKSFEQEYVEEGAELLCVELQQPPPFVAERIRRKGRGEGEEKGVELGPGRPALDSFGKKPVGLAPAAPGGQESTAPPNVVKIHNIPKEIEAPELKSSPRLTAVISEPELKGEHHDSIVAGVDSPHKLGEATDPIEGSARITEEWANRRTDSKEEEEATEIRDEPEKKLEEGKTVPQVAVQSVHSGEKKAEDKDKEERIEISDVRVGQTHRLVSEDTLNSSPQKEDVVEYLEAAPTEQTHQYFTPSEESLASGKVDTANEEETAKEDDSDAKEEKHITIEDHILIQEDEQPEETKEQPPTHQGETVTPQTEQPIHEDPIVIVQQSISLKEKVDLLQVPHQERILSDRKPILIEEVPLLLQQHPTQDHPSQTQPIHQELIVSSQPHDQTISLHAANPSLPLSQQPSLSPQPSKPLPSPKKQKAKEQPKGWFQKVKEKVEQVYHDWVDDRKEEQPEIHLPQLQEDSLAQQLRNKLPPNHTQEQEQSVFQKLKEKLHVGEETSRLQEIRGKIEEVGGEIEEGGRSLIVNVEGELEHDSQTHPIDAIRDKTAKIVPKIEEQSHSLFDKIKQKLQLHDPTPKSSPTLPAAVPSPPKPSSPTKPKQAPSPSMFDNLKNTINRRLHHFAEFEQSSEEEPK